MKTFLICICLVTSMASCSNYVGPTGSAPFDPDKFSYRNFTFNARTAVPTRGSARALNSQYDVRITRDSLIAFLPYFGVSQSAPQNSDEAGIRFTTTSFSANSKKLLDGWEVTIDIRDQRFVNTMAFTIFSNGSASLDVSSSLRDFISYKGEVRNN